MEERTTKFAEKIRDFYFSLPKNTANHEYIPQLILSGVLPVANYLEANVSIDEKDFKMKINTCRHQSKESSYWLRLIITDVIQKEYTECLARLKIDSANN